MRYVLLLAALLCGMAVSAPVAKGRGYWAQLTLDACPADILALLPDEAKPAILGVAKTWANGKPFLACWALVPPDVRLIYQDDDQGSVPMAAFHDEADV